MPEVILHHYPQSPVAEKVRVVLGLKGLDWHSVQIPRLPPKPDLMPLTGGYRLTPTLQIGADVYCDSLCIIGELERRYPNPTLFPGGADGLAWGVSRWTDGPFFKTAISVVFGAAADSLPPDFAADRGRLYFGPDFDLAEFKPRLAGALAQLRAQLDWIDQRLATGRDFILGDKPGLPDALCYYLVWFVRGRYDRGPEILSEFSHLEAWESRVRDVGHGKPKDLDPSEALAIAKAAEVATEPYLDSRDPLGLELGDSVAVAPDDDSGNPPVTGALLSLTKHEVAVRREDPQVGEVAVHFPRIGYAVKLT